MENTHPSAEHAAAVKLELLKAAPSPVPRLDAARGPEARDQDLPDDARLVDIYERWFQSALANTPDLRRDHDAEPSEHHDRNTRCKRTPGLPSAPAVRLLARRKLAPAPGAARGDAQRPPAALGALLVGPAHQHRSCNCSAPEAPAARKCLARWAMVDVGGSMRR